MADTGSYSYNPYQDQKVVGKVDRDEMHENARIADQYWRRAHPEMHSDLQFLAGNQWDETDRAIRLRARRPVITVNDLGQYIDQLVGDLRQNPTSIGVVPSDFAGANNVEFLSNSGRTYPASEVMAGLIRQIEYKSNAQLHYSLAGQAAGESGLGFLRVYSEYCDLSTMEQDIRVERIKDRFSVLCDPTVVQPDWSDQNYSFVGAWMPRKQFGKRWPTAHPTPVTDAEAGYWQKDNSVRVTEYYWRDPIKVEIVQLDNGSIFTDGNDQPTAELKAAAAKMFETVRNSGRVVRSRTAYPWQVKWSLQTYNDTLEGPFILPGTQIPVIPVIGKRIEGDEDTLYYGLPRFAKEPKKMQNYWLTAGTERIAQMPKAPWLITDEQVEGYENDFTESNLGLKPYVRYNFVNGQPAPSRQMPPTIPAGEMSMMMQMGEMVKGAIGQHDASVGKASNQQSGRALIQLEHSSDVGNFVFSDNLNVAVNYVGRVFLDWVGAVYDQARFITIRHRNDEVDTIEINKVVKQADGSTTIINDITQGRFDQQVQAGPSYSTLRQEGASMMLDVVKAMPQAMAVTADLIVDNLDFPNSDVMAARLRKLVPMGIRDDSELSDEERRNPPQPTLDQQVGIAHAQGQLALANARTAEAEGRQAQADGLKATAIASVVEAQAAIAKSGMALDAAHADALSNMLAWLQAESQGQVTNGQPGPGGTTAQPGQPQQPTAAPVPAQQPQQQQPQAQPQNSGQPDPNQPVSMADFDALKTEVAQMLVALSKQTKGWPQNG